MSWSDPLDRRAALHRLAAGGAGLGLAAGLGGLLGGCGFHPLYARDSETGDSTVNHLHAIRVAPLRDRVGQQLHNLLRNRLNPYGQPSAPAYVLDVSLRETVRELALRTDETATRADLNIVASYTLTRPGASDVLFSGQSQSVNSYNILQSQFATQASENDARERSLRELSDDIRAQLAIYFTRQADL
jgi:LPS-assembly lipoprotein